MKNMKWFIGLIPFALMGCGGDDGSLMQGGTATSAQMQQARVVQAVAGFLNFTKAGPSGGGLPTLPGTALPGGIGTLSLGPAAAPDYSACKTVLADDDTDTDGDGIPRHVKISYDCRDLPPSDPSAVGKEKLIGTYESKDLKDVDASTKFAQGGYEFNYDIQEESPNSIAGVAPWETLWKGSYSARPTATTLTFSTDYQWWYTGVDGLPGKLFRIDWGGKIQNKSIYTPKDMSLPFEEGSVKHAGLFKMEGHVGSDTSGRDLGHVEVTFKVTSTDLVYKPACHRYYESGELAFEGSPGTKLVLKFSCANVDVFFNGQPITMTGL